MADTTIVPSGGLRRGEFYMLSSATANKYIGRSFSIGSTSALINEALTEHPEELGKEGDTAQLCAVEVSKPVEGKFQVLMTFDIIPRELKDCPMQEGD